jgi:methylisocitrate lyase
MKIKQHPGKILRALMDSKCIMCPGAFNGLVGRIVADQGYEAAYVSGGAITTSAGVPDIGLLPIDGFTKIISEVWMSTNLPIIADADTGFGEGEMVARTVWEYNKAGAAGLHIEDQVFPKRCGHLGGKGLVPTEDFAHKVRIAAEARDECSEGDFIICARTDARSVEGLDSTIERAKQYIDAGADMIFPEGLSSLEEFERVSKELKEYSPKTYLLANMTEFGKTPIIDLEDFGKIGYDIVIYPVSTMRIAMKAVEVFLAQLKEDGNVSNSLDKMLTRDSLYDLVNYKPGEEWIYPSPKKKDK